MSDEANRNTTLQRRILLRIGGVAVAGMAAGALVRSAAQGPPASAPGRATVLTRRVGSFSR